jgi:hypothetical protein
MTITRADLLKEYPGASEDVLKMLEDKELHPPEGELAPTSKIVERNWRSMTEKQFAAEVEPLFKLYHWKYYHTFNSQHSVPGFPDYVAIREKVIFIELKTETGKITPAQIEWIKALRKAKQQVYIWRPSDFDLIVKALR